MQRRRFKKHTHRREQKYSTRRPNDRNSEYLLYQRLLTLTTTLIDVIKQMPPTQPANDGASMSVVQPSRLYAATMLRPGQPGAPFFDKNNVTDFLRQWNVE